MIIKTGSTSNGWEYFIETHQYSSAPKRYFRQNRFTGESNEFTDEFKQSVSFIIERHRKALELLSK